jgi:hypothetical protein
MRNPVKGCLKNHRKGCIAVCVCQLRLRYSVQYHRRGVEILVTWHGTVLDRL